MIDVSRVTHDASGDLYKEHYPGDPITITPENVEGLFAAAIVSLKCRQGMKIPTWNGTPINRLNVQEAEEFVAYCRSNLVVAPETFVKNYYGQKDT